MLQRVQTIYIALAIILLVVCCCVPLATLEPRNMGLSHVLYSLMLIDGGGRVTSFHPLILFVLTIVAEIVLVCALCGYRNRRRQMRMCSIAVVFELLWIIAFVILCALLRNDMALHVRAVAFCPLVAMLFTLLARRMIRKDEALVRSADRIR